VLHHSEDDLLASCTLDLSPAGVGLDDILWDLHITAPAVEPLPRDRLKLYSADTSTLSARTTGFVDCTLYSKLRNAGSTPDILALS